MMQSAAIFGCEGPSLSAAEAAFFREANPWAFILFARNIETPEQVAALTASLRACVGRDAPVLIDQEGGRVQRMRAPHWREWRPTLDQVRGLSPEEAARSMYLRYRLIAAELRAAGLDVNCAPLADIARPETHAILRNRCYGETVADVVRAARAVSDGLLAGGVLPVLKHIPGHGRGTLDSHLDLPRVDAPRATLEAEDFAAFHALADLPLAMTAHIVFSAFDDARPATQSRVMIDLIRQEIGFAGLLMTDDISMQALAGPIERRCTASLEAGCDLILHCNGDMSEMEEVAGACGHLSGAGAMRADAALAARHATDAFDAAAAEAELAEILQVHG